ncbi:MAG: CPBP family intramembrane metalloprotease [Clostridia bacterium]|jgi:membrane protease YdiL (CAAX protease family)|nr:CPBP family intramembrane metalloprotease [Clostridia bacterium]MCI1999276.1 CPBP family intramembrane metalloprotease [Clostridia bacterium]MCI2014771.1 CPBP family intramembrane metalloprotease [Clostridia bacterium]
MKLSAFTAAFFSLILILSMFVFSFLFGFFKIDNMLISIFSEEIFVFGIPTFLFFYITKANPKDVFSLHPIGAANIIIIFLISITMQPILMSVSAFSSIFFENDASEFLQSMASFPALPALLMAALMPAFFEEMYFRGIIFSNYRHVEIKKACLMTGLFFGLAHMNPQQFLYAFIMGTVFCYFVYRTGSIFSSMLSHFTINGTQTILSAYMTRNFSQGAVSQAAAENSNFSDFIPFFVLSIISLIPVILLFIAFERINKPKYSDIVSEKALDFNCTYYEQEKVLYWPLIVILIIYALYILKIYI